MPPLNPNAKNLPQGGGGDFEHVDPGTHIGTLVGMAYLGEIEDSFQGEATCRPEIFLRFETPFNQTSDGKPKIIDRKVTFSFYEKSNFAKFAAALDPYNEEEGTGFGGDRTPDYDAFSLLGKSCQLAVVPYTTKQGNKRTKIDNALALAQGMNVPEPLATPWQYDVCEHDPEAFEKVPQWVRELAANNVRKYSGVTIGNTGDEDIIPNTGSDPNWWGNHPYDGTNLSVIMGDPGQFAVVAKAIITGGSEEEKNAIRQAIAQTEWTVVRVVEELLRDKGVDEMTLADLKASKFPDDVRAVGYLKNFSSEVAALELPVEGNPVEDAPEDDIPF